MSSDAVYIAVVAISIGIATATGGKVTIDRTPDAVVEYTSSMQGVGSGTLAEAEEHRDDVYVDNYGWIKLEYSKAYDIMDGHLTRLNGTLYVYGHKETWYSTREKAGKTTARDIPGKHAADDGTIRDVDGFICVASSDLPFYSIVMTSVGPGKVYDCGCSSGTIDVYTTW